MSFNLESPERPAFAAGAEAETPTATEGAGITTTGPLISPAHRALDRNASATAPVQTPTRQPVVMAPQAPWALPPEVAAPPASQVAPPLDSSSRSAASTSRCCGRQPQATQPSAVLTGQQRARERALPQASRQRARRQAPRLPTGRNDLSN